MVHGHPAVVFLVVLEHREVHHPQRCPAVFKQAVLLAEFAVADLDAQRADGVVDDLFLVGAEEQQVAVLCAGALQDFGNRCVVDVFTMGDCKPSRPFASSLTLIQASPWRRRS